MESYGTTRFETKIETFDPCIIQVGGQQREIGRNLDQTGASEEARDAEDHQDVSTMQDDSEQQPTQIPTIQSNAAPNMTLTSVRLPAILDGEFFTVIRVEDTNVTVRCQQCQKLLNGNLKSTGNFLSHIKVIYLFFYFYTVILNC